MVASDGRRRVPLGGSHTGLADSLRVHWTRRENLTWQVGDRGAARLPAQIVRLIEFSGLEIPLLAMGNEPSSVVLGNRRAAAIKGMRHFDEVPVFVAHGPADLERWLVADRKLDEWNQGPAGMPWTWRQRADVLGAALAGLDDFRGGGAGGSRGGSPTDMLAAYFDVPEVQLRNALYLLRFERSGGGEAERATQALDLAEAGVIKPQSAYRKLRDGHPMQVGVGATKPGATAAEQAKVLRQAGEALAGITHGLKQLGDIDPAMPADTRAALLGPLAEARTALSRITRQLAPTNKGDEQE